MGLFSPFAEWTKGLRNKVQTSSFFYLLNGFTSDNRESEQAIIEGAYIRNATAYSIVSKLSKLTARLPFHFEYKDTPLEEGEFVEFWRAPNADLRFRDYVYQASTYLYLLGDFYAKIDEEAVGFNDIELIPLPPQLVNCVKENEGTVLSKVKYYQLNDGAINQRIECENIIHCKHFDPSLEGLRLNNGLSPFQAGSLTVRASNNANIAEATTFENGAVSHLIFSKKGGVTLSKQDKETIDGANRDRFGGAHKTGSTYTVTGEAQSLKIGSTPKELGIPEERVALLREMCNLLGVNSAEFNDPANKTFANAKEARRAMYADVVIPQFELIMEEHIYKLAERYGLDPNELKVVVDTEKIDAMNPEPLEVRKQDVQEYKDGLISREYFTEKYNIEDNGQTFANNQEEIIEVEEGEGESIEEQ